MPMWCSATDSPKSHGHHRIVRIPPGESVVLNSAERAPYLLLIEILDDDLDFDPTKRSNRDLLTKIVMDAEGGSKTHGRSSTLGRAPSFRGARRPLINVVEPSPLGTSHGPETPEWDQSAEEGDGPVIGEVIPPTPMERPLDLEQDEEMDLVEQVYGNDLKSQGEDLSESIVLPPQPKNKTLEMRTWAASAPPSPNAVGPVHRSSAEISPIGTNDHGRFPSLSQDMTMDDYSERMRTAASMLAQLNASLVKEPVTTIPDHPEADSPPPPPPAATGSGPLRWLPGKGWILGAVASSLSSRAAVDPSSAAPTPTRMKLQPSEVAAITERIMQEMLALEEERMQRMQERVDGATGVLVRETPGGKTAEDESIVRRELNKADPSGMTSNFLRFSFR